MNRTSRIHMLLWQSRHDPCVIMTMSVIAGIPITLSLAFHGTYDVSAHVAAVAPVNSLVASYMLFAIDMVISYLIAVGGICAFRCIRRSNAVRRLSESFKRFPHDRGNSTSAPRFDPELVAPCMRRRHAAFGVFRVLTLYFAYVGVLSVFDVSGVIGRSLLSHGWEVDVLLLPALLTYQLPSTPVALGIGFSVMSLADQPIAEGCGLGGYRNKSAAAPPR